MPDPFMKLTVRAGDLAGRPVDTPQRRVRGLAGVAPEVVEDSRFHSDEAAARHFLSASFERDERAAVRSLSAPERPEIVPDFRLRAVREQPLTGTRTVTFDQMRSAIPVFGSKAVVELDPDREMVSMDARVADIGGISPFASVSPGQAAEAIAEAAGVSVAELGELPAPELTWFHHPGNGSWHLAYYFRRVPAVPTEMREDLEDEERPGHGLGGSPRDLHPEVDYLVDAHDGTLLYDFSANPTLLDIPVKCRGVDELGSDGEFFGRQAGAVFELSDPVRKVRTFDLGLQDLDHTPRPADPVHAAGADFAATNPAAISAHVNATRVFDFYNGVLKRDSVDNQGMELVSIVNCTLPADQAPPEWFNAVWFQHTMFYGQVRDGNGDLRSFSRFLDVIAHELTHGVTEFTSDLVYKDQSGALNESFSDIFGVIVNNWYTVGEDSSVEQWSWEIGPGLGGGGRPLRDLSDPARLGQPAHVDDFVVTSRDSGGVHTNSNIHNKAAFEVLTARDEGGALVFGAREVAILYYLALTRLNRLAVFSDVLDTLLTVAATFYAGDPDERDRKSEAIRQAYGRVGIT